MAKKFVGIRMGDVEQELLALLQARLGANQASVIAMALRELARKEGVPIPATKEVEKGSGTP